jgi:hypothetical protein
MSATILRELPGYSSQFFAYEAIKRWMKQRQQEERERSLSSSSICSLSTDSHTISSDIDCNPDVDHLGALSLITAGGLAGIFGWLCSYPFDFIKSQLQSEPIYKKIECSKEIERIERIEREISTKPQFEKGQIDQGQIARQIYDKTTKKTYSYINGSYYTNYESGYKKSLLRLDGGVMDCYSKIVNNHIVETEVNSTNSNASNASNMVNLTKNKKNYWALWRGFATCGARAVPANAVGFLAYEVGLEICKKANKTYEDSRKQALLPA